MSPHSDSSPGRVHGTLRGGAVATLLLVAITAFDAVPALGQSAEEQIRALVGENAEGYLRPLSDGMTFALTGGVFDAARVRGLLSFDLGIRVNGARPGESARSFLAVLPDTLRWAPPGVPEQVFTDPLRPVDGSLRTPSAVGSGPGIRLEPDGAYREALLQAGENPDDYRITLPEGLDLSVVPTAILSFSVGVGFGTEISARYLPRVEINDEIGRVGATGWGVQHMVSQWFASPVDLSVGVGRQDLEVGDFLDARASEGWLSVGRTVGPLSVFGTAGLRSATVDVTYEVENPDGTPGLPASGTPVQFRSDLDTTTSLGAGFRLQLLFMNLSGRYTTGDFDTFSVHVGFGMP